MKVQRSLGLLLRMFLPIGLGLRLRILLGNLWKLDLSCKGCWRQREKKEYMVGMAVELPYLNIVAELLCHQKRRGCWNRSCSPEEW